MKLSQVPSRVVRNLRDDHDEPQKRGPGRPPAATILSDRKVVSGYLIEQDIPVPLVNRSSALYEALGALEPGESILFKNRKTASVPSKCKSLWPTRFFVARNVGDGVRIWRKN